MGFRTLLGSGLLFLVTLVPGCGDSGPKIYAISGVATLNGKPMPNLVVRFRPDDRDHIPTGSAITDDSGHFTMTVGSKKGVMPGGYTVTVADSMSVSGGHSSTDPSFLAAMKKYGDKSPLHVTIDKDDSTFELKLD